MVVLFNVNHWRPSGHTLENVFIEGERDEFCGFECELPLPLPVRQTVEYSGVCLY